MKHVDWKVEAYEVLLDLTHGIFPKDWRMNIGLCNNLRWTLEERGVDYQSLYELKVWMKKTFTTWSRYSGDPGFPVPSCDKDLKLMDAYYNANNLYEGEYGCARMELAMHLVDTMIQENLKVARIALRKHLIKTLEGVLEGNYPQIWDMSEGICYNMQMQMNFRVPYALRHEMIAERRRAFESWEEYSGNPTWPIANGDADPKRSYNYCLNKWTDSKYGKARKRLLQHVVNCLKSGECRVDSKEPVSSY